jgi:hypothetical protein
LFFAKLVLSPFQDQVNEVSFAEAIGPEFDLCHWVSNTNQGGIMDPTVGLQVSRTFVEEILKIGEKF